MKDWKVPGLISIEISPIDSEGFSTIDGNSIFSTFKAEFKFEIKEGTWFTDFLIRVSKFETPTIAIVNIRGFQSNAMLSKTSQKMANETFKELLSKGLSERWKKRDEKNENLLKVRLFPGHYKIIRKERYALFSVAVADSQRGSGRCRSCQSCPVVAGWVYSKTHRRHLFLSAHGPCGNP